jgi:GTPase SAR1 family protein
MTLPKKKTSGKISIEELRWLLYGPPKIGKTSLLTGFPNAYFMATEKGYKSLKVYKDDITSWEVFEEKVEDIVSGKHDFETVVIDTADGLFDMCSDVACQKLGIEHESDAEWGKGWAETKKIFTRALQPLFMSDYGIVFISHTKGDKITTQVEEITKTVPTLSNQARKILLPLVDTIGCLRYKRHKIGKGEYEERYIISFKPSEMIEAGDRTGLLPSELRLDVVPEDVKRTPDVVAKYAKRNYERIAKYYR